MSLCRLLRIDDNGTALALALLLYGTGFYLSAYPDPHHGGYRILTSAWSALCATCVLGFIIFSSEIRSASDFRRYQAWYDALARGRGIGFNMEPGFTALAWPFTSGSIPFTVFMCAIASLLMASLWRLLRYTMPPGAIALGIFTYLNFFAFYNIIFNTIRTGASLAFLVFSLPFIMQRRLLPALVMICVAASIHRTGLFGLLLFGVLSPAVSSRRLLAANVVLFTCSFIGINEIFAGPLLSNVGVAAEKWTFYSDPAYAGHPGRNRIDFFVFTLLPAIVAIGLRTVLTKPLTGLHDHADVLLRAYLLLMIPFSAFSFMPYSDRFALFSWILWPVVAAMPVLHMRSSGSIRDMVNRLLLISVLVAVPNFLQYQSTLFTIAVALQNAVVYQAHGDSGWIPPPR